MNKHTSIYLDILRILSTMLVYFFHMGHFSNYRIPYLSSWSKEAVISFFVLSGLVICFSADCKHKDLVDYGISRVSRLWSVVIPALFVTLLSDIIGQSIDITQYGNIQSLSFYKWVLLIISNALFLNQIWGLNLPPGSNGPFWSISYEFWYYCIFGALFYLKGIHRILTVSLISIICGLNILIAFPAWLIGALLYKIIKSEPSRNKYLSKKQFIGSLIFVSSLTFFTLFYLLNIQEKLELYFINSAEFSKWEVDFWPKTYIIATLIALNIYGYSLAGGFTLKFLSRHQVNIKKISNWTFGIYLFHYPLGYLFKTIASKTFKIDTLEYVIFIYAFTLIASILCAELCEKNKNHFKTIIFVVYNKVYHFICIRITKSSHN